MTGIGGMTGMIGIGGLGAIIGAGGTGGTGGIGCAAVIAGAATITPAINTACHVCFTTLIVVSCLT
jgi:hypothetical protein